MRSDPLPRWKPMRKGDVPPNPHRFLSAHNPAVDWIFVGMLPSAVFDAAIHPGLPTAGLPIAIVGGLALRALIRHNDSTRAATS